MNIRTTKLGSLMIIICIVINIIMISSLGVFSLLVLTREAVDFRKAHETHIHMTQNLLNYGISTVLANRTALDTQTEQTIVLKLTDLPGISPELYGTITITGDAHSCHIESQLKRKEDILCRGSCTIKQGDTKQLEVNDWKIG